jgi:ribosomal protein S18 acetylase RimI-like enzyme
MKVEIVERVDDEVVAAFARLVPQLSSSPPPDRAALDAIVAHEAATVFVARDDSGAIVGTMTLVLFPIPTGLRAIIDDVIVDESARGTGVVEALNAAVLDRARAYGARTVDLTSRPSRVAANRVYARLGFAQRDTNVWRFDLGS